MIAFTERSMLENIKRLWPAYRRRRDAEMREAIRELVANPSAPCMIDGAYIPNGYGYWNITPPPKHPWDW